jgi:Cu+-exporting ATPase
MWNRSFDANTEQEEQRHREQLGKYFTVAVLLLAGTAAGYWFFQHQHERMWNALTTVLIVACPFALLFASHFTSGHLLRILSQTGSICGIPTCLEPSPKPNTWSSTRPER